jgi:hypothetical protein
MRADNQQLIILTSIATTEMTARGNGEIDEKSSIISCSRIVIFFLAWRGAFCYDNSFEKGQFAFCSERGLNA